MSKKKLIYFSHYIDEEINNENLNFMISEKGVSYGFYYWIIYGYLLMEKDHKININDKKQLLFISQRFRCNIQEAKDILNILIECEVVEKEIVNETTFVYNLDVLNELNIIDKKSKVAKENASKRWNDKTSNQNKPKPIETQKKENNNLDKDQNDKESFYYCNPKYKKVRKALEEVITDELGVIPEFYGKNPMQKSALKNLFDMVNSGLISASANLEVSEWFTHRAIESKQRTRNKSFILSDFNNYLVDVIEADLNGINIYSEIKFSKKDLVRIESKHDGYFGEVKEAKEVEQDIDDDDDFSTFPVQ